MINGVMAVYPETGHYKADDIAWGEFYTRWVKLLDTHKQISMEMTGLSDKEDLLFLNDYDFVFLYLIPRSKTDEEKYWWYEYPDIIRERFGYKGKLILQIDYEGIMKQLPPFIQNTINKNCNAVFYNSPIASGWYFFKPRYEMMMIPPVKELDEKIRKNNLSTLIDERDKAIGILWHSASGASIETSLRVCAGLSCKAKVFTSWLDMKKDWLKDYVSRYIPRPEWTYYGEEKDKWGVECFEFMDYNKYLKELGKCWVVLEDNDNYYGFSRIAYECSVMLIPVVGSTNNTACNIAYPRTTTNPQNTQLQTQLIKRLFTDREYYYEIVGNAWENMRDYLSNKNQLEKFIKVLRNLRLL